MQLHHDRYPTRPLLDTAVSHALLRRVARGEAPESLRLYRPDDALLFSTLDVRRPGFARAVELARAAGFPPVLRLAGGHAAAFLSSAVAFAWATPDPDAALRIESRFERLTGWIVSALSALGLDARIGALPREYCPGDFSVHVAVPRPGGGERRIKVMGVGQRVIRGAAHVGGVVTVGDGARLRALLEPVYEALDLDFDPGTAGGLAEADDTLTPERVIEAIADRVRADGIALVPATFDSALEGEAETLRSTHALG